MATSAERTDPKLWEEVKAEVTAGSKGGRKGQWSARKAQLAAHIYQERGGGYKGGKSKDNSLQKWTDEDWGTKSGKKSEDTGERYLPKKARDGLSKDEYQRTSDKKRRDTRKGKQHSSQPEDVKKKTARARGGEPTKSDLYEQAKRKKIEGRSTMTKAELARALEKV